MLKERQSMLVKLLCMYVCVSEKHKQKTDKSDMKRYSLLCKAGFFLLKYFFAITNLC